MVATMKLTKTDLVAIILGLVLGLFAGNLWLGCNTERLPIGSPCESNADCESNFCLKKISTEEFTVVFDDTCTEWCRGDYECPDDYRCVGLAGADNYYFCLPECGSNADCSEETWCQCVGDCTSLACYGDVF